MLAGAVLAVLFAAAIGFIETVGREGTIVGRYERIKHGASEAELVAVMGEEAARRGQMAIGTHLDLRLEWADGLGRVYVALATKDAHEITFFKEYKGGSVVWTSTSIVEPRKHFWTVASTKLELEDNPTLLWRCRRWAEQAYTAIHGPRR